MSPFLSLSQRSITATTLKVGPTQPGKVGVRMTGGVKGSGKAIRSVILLILCSSSLARAQSGEVVVKLAEGNGTALVKPRIDSGYVEIEIRDSNGQRVGKAVALPLRNQVAPEVSVDVKSTGGGFRFQYSVRNGESARQRINNWDLVLPTKEAVGGAEQPKLWNSAAVISKVSEVRHGLDGAATGAIFSWYRALDPAPSIGRGDTLSGFVINSRYIPGIVYSYTFGEWPDDSILGDLPTEVTKALLPYLGGEYQSQPRITIGPFFPPGTSLAIMIESYRQRLTSARKPFLGGISDSYLKNLLELLARAGNVTGASQHSGLVELCEFCKTSGRLPAEESLRQGIQAALCASGR